MQTLEALFRRFDKQSDARWWIGRRPAVRADEAAKAIAGQVGLPTSVDDPFVANQMVTLDWARAAHVLAVAGTTSLVWDKRSPSEDAIRDTKAALKDLSGTATFLSNGHWVTDATWWHPITSATFDCGVIGFDRDNAFIFWVEEED